MANTDRTRAIESAWAAEREAYAALLAKYRTFDQFALDAIANGPTSASEQAAAIETMQEMAKVAEAAGVKLGRWTLEDFAAGRATA